MSRDHNDIYSIVERLRILEEGLDKNQKSVNQLSATFKPKTVAVLTAKKDPKNPMAGKLVGSDESVERDETMLEADMAEDVLEKVKKSFTDFIKQAEQSIDKEVQEKKREDTDLKKKDKKDRDLIAKDKPVAEDPTQEEPDVATTGSAEYPITPESIEEEGEMDSALSGIVPAQQPAGEEGVSMKESHPVKSITLEDGAVCEIHGDEGRGFEIKHGNRSMPSRFKNLDQAEMAIKMFQHRRRKNNEAQDYLDEE